MSRSPVLIAVVPEVRRRALIETAARMTDDTALHQLFIETLSQSSYLPEQAKVALADAVFSQQWASVARLLQCELQTTHVDVSPVAAFER